MVGMNVSPSFYCCTARVQCLNVFEFPHPLGLQPVAQVQAGDPEPGVISYEDLSRDKAGVATPTHGSEKKTESRNGIT